MERDAGDTFMIHLLESLGFLLRVDWMVFGTGYN